ncbi:stage III sporulation protein AB [Sulfobacillus thermosulfidooxidans]|uniref:stage III sporulation protein AB n=1 Tax=Sulfobacillus thermosulfidooxidans TaxID=28034 RepID=UPI00096B7B13|nr:stage III sporulation protein AB [Sulfobacillus thermosulfidooxidans]OLZ08548.1 hypothetical protein BFX05_03190 [Sulfobacillus thermosulfidooxidans]OLZ13150.1 hypothetical protein BFX06_11440 [Sulfobacillus thermosulfidooxidans]OLZ21530.1 hypothetical protein BFX07_11865 [Sulfobacillus thermosulfidooxidans]
MKLVGAICIIAAAWWVGRLLAKPYRQRIVCLEQGLALLDQLRAEIGWHHRVLTDAFKRASCSYSAWKPMAEYLSQQIDQHETDFTTAFHHALDRVLGLWTKDREIWENLGQVLGKSAVDYQLEHLQSAHHELARQLTDARTQGLKTARMMEALVSLTGVAIVIVLI